jgi:hypothetical protein
MSFPKFETPDKTKKLLHSIALTLLAGSEAEVAGVLGSLLTWSNPEFKLDPEITQIKLLPKPSPILIQSLARFINNHINQWRKGPGIEPAMTALTVVNNLVYSHNKKVNIENATIIAASSEMMVCLQRISFHPFSPVSSLAQTILTMIARFCNIEKTVEDPQRFMENICSLFMLSDPVCDEKQIIIALNFALLPSNCTMMMEQLGADIITNRISQLLSYPSMYLRDFLLEVLYALLSTTPEIKESVCKNEQLLRKITALCIPQFEPTEQKNTIPLSPCQKACAFIVELLDDPRVLQFVAFFKVQFATAALKWKSSWLTELAAKISCATTK